jgi:hypothetical protein
MRLVQHFVLSHRSACSAMDTKRPRTSHAINGAFIPPSDLLLPDLSTQVFGQPLVRDKFVDCLQTCRGGSIQPTPLCYRAAQPQPASTPIRTYTIHLAKRERLPSPFRGIDVQLTNLSGQSLCRLGSRDVLRSRKREVYIISAKRDCRLGRALVCISRVLYSVLSSSSAFGH